MLCVTRYFLNRVSIWTLLFTLMAGLGACRDTVIRPNPDRALEFGICQEALSTLPKRGAYQGRDGWFYFNHDFWGEYPNLQETDFIVRVKQALETQGVALVLVPLPGVGMSNPEFLYRDDPWQKAFSPAQAQADYRAYVNTLRGQGVKVVDALAAMQAYDAAGGQTFFKRDVHWTPDGANAVAQEIAKSVRRVVTTALPTSAIKLSRALPDKPFYGKHINSWTSEYCGYHLPAEPLRNYTLQSSNTETRAEVIQVGSSFSVPPFDVGFLAVAPQSPVFNASIGGGGAVFPLETYLRGDLYEARRPKVIVWEFPISVHHIIELQQRRMVAAVYGVCNGAEVHFQKTYRLEGNGLSVQNCPL